MISNTSYSSPSDIDIDSDHQQDRVYLAKAKVNNIRYCYCPGSEPGKVKADPAAHLSNCRFRKNKIINISTPSKISDGYSLGVPI
ncbi:MAG TPA: hypothetical protein VH415_02555 [Nitrososphaeraceae archaeon]|jgi:hypothetical protein